MDTRKLRRKVRKGMTPVVLVACGSFSPITLLHLRIFEDARAALAAQNMDVVLGVLSPVHAAYGKTSLVSMEHRLNMVELAVEDSDWLTVSRYECSQNQWTPTRAVLAWHAAYLAREPVFAEGEEERGEQTGLIKTMLICGSDLVETFPNVRSDGSPVWDPLDQAELLRLGLVVIERQGSDLAALVRSEPIFQGPEVRIHIVQPRAFNTISSSAVRLCLKNGESIKYFVPDPVIKYINDHVWATAVNWRN